MRTGLRCRGGANILFVCGRCICTEHAVASDGKTSVDVLARVTPGRWAQHDVAAYTLILPTICLGNTSQRE